MSQLSEMSPLMRELCIYHGQLWRKDHPDESVVVEFEVAKAFVQSAAERGLARLVKNEQGNLVWEVTPKIFRDLGEIRVPQLHQPQDDEEPAHDAEEDQRAVQLAVPKGLVRDIDWMTAELVDYVDTIYRAIEVFHALRQRAFDLLEAIGEDPLGGIQREQAESPERDLSEPPPSG
jgi:hypothetical protein